MCYRKCVVLYEVTYVHARCCDFETIGLSISILKCIANNLSHLIIEAVGFLSNLPFILAMFTNYHLCVCVCVCVPNATIPIHIPFELLKREREKRVILEKQLWSQKGV